MLKFSVPLVGEEEINAVTEVLRSGWLVAGKKVEQFEKEFAKFVGCKEAVFVNSCTSALFLSLLARKVGCGDEVITTPLTYTATAQIIHITGAKVVFADITDDLLIDVN